MLIFMVLDFMEGDVGESVKAVDRSRGDGGTGDDVRRAIRDVEEGVIFWVVKDRPGELRSWETWDKGLEDAGGNVKRAWVVPSVVRALKDLEDGGSGVCNVLLINIIKGGPGSDGDIGEGRGGNDSGLRRSE